MSAIRESIERLAERPCCGYRPGAPPAVEPTALAAMALMGHAHAEAAVAALDWLAGVQSEDGSLGVDASSPRPGWPTGWAVQAWQTALRLPQTLSPNSPRPLAGDQPGVRAASCSSPRPLAGEGLGVRALGSGKRFPDSRWSQAADKAGHWILSFGGVTIPPSAAFGHDTMLVAWPWVEGTHSWVEPSAINLLALKSLRRGDHPRSREAVKLLVDRMLPSGGWNYGNSIVLGNTLVSQLEPTGVALAALAGQSTAQNAIDRSIGYVRRRLSADTPIVSLAYSLIGLSCQGRRPAKADGWLEAACRRTLDRDASPYKLALAALAALPSGLPWLSLS